MQAGTSYLRDTWDPLMIGGGRGMNNNKFGGAIDEVAIYTNALTAAQVLNHYNTALNSSPSTPYEQVIANDNAYMYWRMNSPGYTAPAESTYPTASFISSNLPEYRIDDLQVASLLSIRIAVDPLITTVSQISFEGSSAYRGERITVSNFGLA